MTNLPELVATVAFCYEPAAYLEHCADTGEEPSLEGWKDFAFELAWSDFNESKLEPTIHEENPFAEVC